MYIPAAEHSRFAHSLGVVKASTEILKRIYADNKEIFADETELEKCVKLLRYSALLHDIGHLPFSHASEAALLKEKKEHEDISSYIVKNHNEIREILDDDGIQPEEVSRVLAGKILPNFELIGKIISGEYDADRTDYLLRDSYFCGVEYGKFDFDRFIDSFNLIRGENGKLELRIKKSHIHAIESLILARYHYYTQVAFHRTRVGYDIIFDKYLEENFEDESNKLLNMNWDFDFWYKLDDNYVMEKIKKDYLENNNKFAEIILRQKHLRPVYDVGSHAEKGEEKVAKRIKLRLEEEGFDYNKDFFTKRLPKAIHKLERNSDEDTSSNNNTDHFNEIINKEGEKIGYLLEKSSLLKRFNDPILIVRIYAMPDKYDEIVEKVEEIRNEDQIINSMTL